MTVQAALIGEVTQTFDASTLNAEYGKQRNKRSPADIGYHSLSHGCWPAEASRTHAAGQHPKERCRSFEIMS